MVKLRTAENNCNNYFYQDDAHKIEGDNNRQEVVFDKGGFATGLPKTTTSPTINPEARQRQRKPLDRLIARFLRNGGKITVCPPAAPNFRFGKFKSPSPLRGMTSTSDLSQRRWHGPTLDARTERDLIRKAKSGDEGAKQKLVEAFHRFVLSIVSKHSGPPHNDLMAAGSLGFVEAISRFNENRGCRLSTYSRHWIEKHVRLAVKDSRWIGYSVFSGIGNWTGGWEEKLRIFRPAFWPGRFTLAPPEAHRLADLLLDALVSGGFEQPDSARVAKNRWN